MTIDMGERIWWEYVVSCKSISTLVVENIAKIITCYYNGFF